MAAGAKDKGSEDACSESLPVASSLQVLTANLSVTPA